MKRFILTLLIPTLIAIHANAQSLTEDDLKQIRESFTQDASTGAIQNILMGEKDINKLALNHAELNSIDHFFKYRVNVKGITNQRSSGRCWMFTSMNVLRPSVMEKFNLKDFDFSHNYLYFWDMLEKSNRFLEKAIETASKPYDDREVTVYFNSPIEDGGVWNLYYNIAGKYGVVPAEAMPETEHSDNTSQLRALLSEKLRREAYAIREAVNKGGKKVNMSAIMEMKKAALKDIYRILALCLGEPPAEFTWRYSDKTGKIVEHQYTPKQFYDDITPADYNPDNYIMIMNDPMRDYYKIYEVDNYTNTVEGVNWVYLNLPNDVIKKAALASIKNNEAMYTSCDTRKQHNRSLGVASPSLYDYESLLGVELAMDKKARILTRQSSSAHAMALIACDTDSNDNPVKWQFENSWGSKSGHDGYLTITDEWFDEYVFRVVIHRRYLDPKSIESLGQKPVKLPVWDFMY